MRCQREKMDLVVCDGNAVAQVAYRHPINGEPRLGLVCQNCSRLMYETNREILKVIQLAVILHSIFGRRV